MPTFQVSLIPSCFRSRRGAAPGCSPYPHQMVKRLNQRHKPTERKVTALPCPLHTRSTCVETQMATLLNPLRWQAGVSRDTHLEDSVKQRQGQVQLSSSVGYGHKQNNSD